MKVAVTQTINCAHQLPGTEVHGHTYRVTAIYRDLVNGDGMVVSFDALRRQLHRVVVLLDHRQLENVIGHPATAERLAKWVRDQLPLPNIQVRVEVGESGWVETE